MFFKEVVDLGHELFNNMAGISASSMAAFWPSDTHARSSKISQGELSMESHMILMSEHISTHFDAPFHCDPGGLTADQYPLERLVIPGHLLDFTSKGVREAITPADFEAAAERSGKPITSGTAVLAWTGQDRNWGKPNFTTDRPYLPTETAEWLAQREIVLFGTDLIGIDDPDDWRWRTHAAFLQNNVPMVQQMCNLGALQGKEFILVVLPLKIRNSTGMPVRPVALVL
jgi:arylformamidase